MSSNFKKFIWVSIILHVLSFVILVYSPTLLKFLPKKETKITWVRLSKGTGLEPSSSSYKKAKGMPESTLREQKAIKEIAKDKKKEIKKKDKPTELSQKKTSPEGGVNLKQPKNKRDSTIENALARVQQQLEQREVQMEAAQIEKEGQGQSPYGSTDVQEGESNPALVAYYSAIKKKINQQWITLPREGGSQSLKVVINVLIDSQGNITSSSYESKSGDITFDLSAMRAIERATPFPPPPEAIMQEAITEGFLIGFDPRSVVEGY